MRREAMAAGTEKPMTISRLVVKVTTVRAIFRCRDEGETEVAVAGRGGGHHPVLRDGLSDRGLDVTLREHGLKRRGGEIAAGGERRLVGIEHGETVELAHEFALARRGSNSLSRHA